MEEWGSREQNLCTTMGSNSSPAARCPGPDGEAGAGGALLESQKVECFVKKVLVLWAWPWSNPTPTPTSFA